MKILTATQIRTAEDNAVKNGIFCYTDLMRAAGESACALIKKKYSVLGKKICIVCGNGNNGGDGLVIARELKKLGAEVNLFFPLGLPKTETALFFMDSVSDIKVIDSFSDSYDIIIDALFGIGFRRMLSEDIAHLIYDINNSSAIKIAIDLPSGIFCDGGGDNNAFKADLTITFSCYKLCQLLPPTSEFCGEIKVIDIGIPIEDYAYLTIEEPEKRPRTEHSHKGTFGTALLFCGSYGMCGAEILAAKSALRSGVGIVKALVCDKNYSAFCSSVPEAVTIPVSTAISGAPQVCERTILSSLSTSNALLLGCGLGTSKESVELVKRTLEYTNIPTIIDADGINILSSNIELIRKTSAPLILTPHPREMARLCGTTTEEIQSNRIKFAKKFAVEYRCFLVLKGSNTVIAAPDGKVFINTTGNSGLATGGSGDVLSGMIVSRLAQGYEPLEAALNSVWLHGKAADIAIKRICKRALLPSDIIEELKTVAD